MFMRRPPVRLQRVGAGPVSSGAADRASHRVDPAPFRILIDGAVYGLSPYGGLISYWDHAISGLADRGFEIEMRMPPDLVAAPPPLPRAPRTRAPTLFISTYYSAPPVPVDAVALVVHDMIYEDQPDVAVLDPIPAITARKRRCIADADLIVVPSHATEVRLRRHHPALESPVFVVHEGVDRVFTSRPDTEEDRLTKLSSVGIERPFLLHVGGRSSYKNFSVVLRAYFGQGLGSDYDLVVVGSEPAATDVEQRLIDQCASEGRVVFAGRLDPSTLVSAYRAAAAVISASTVEGFGLPVVEAVASGTPVACSRIAAYEETVGDVAHLFSPEDPADCARAVRGALALSRNERERASVHVRQTFDWERTTDLLTTAFGAAIHIPRGR